MEYTLKDLILTLIMNHLGLMMTSHSFLKSHNVKISRRVSAWLFLDRKLKKVPYPAIPLGLWVVPSSVIYTFVFIIYKAFSVEKLDVFLQSYDLISLPIIAIAGFLALVLVLVEGR